MGLLADTSLAEALGGDVIPGTTSSKAAGSKIEVDPPEVNYLSMSTGTSHDAIKTLKTNQNIVKLRSGDSEIRGREPILIETPLIDIQKNLTMRQINPLMRKRIEMMPYWNGALELLKRKGWLREDPIRIRIKLNTSANFQCPTDKLYHYFGKPKGRGQYQHQYWQYHIADMFKDSVIEDNYYFCNLYWEEGRMDEAKPYYPECPKCRTRAVMKELVAERAGSEEKMVWSLYCPNRECGLEWIEGHENEAKYREGYPQKPTECPRCRQEGNLTAIARVYS